MTFFLVFYGLISFAQSGIERQVFGSQGSTGQTKTIIMDWTIGESIVAGSITSFGTLNAGFQQTFRKSEIPHISETKDFSISIVPNPAATWITLKYIQQPEGILYWVLYDLNGRLLRNDQISDTKNPDIDISSYPDGVYILKITGDNYFQTHRLVKTTFF